jgi:hypothetical protein
LVAKLVVCAKAPGALVSVSFTASTIGTETGAELFDALESLLAPVVPVTNKVVGAVSVPPAVPGTTIVKGQVIVFWPVTARSTEEIAGVQVPTVTVAPGTVVVAVHVGVCAGPGPLLVHVTEPVTVVPGDTTAGITMATLMSDTGGGVHAAPSEDLGDGNVTPVVEITAVVPMLTGSVAKSLPKLNFTSKSLDIPLEYT